MLRFSHFNLLWCLSSFLGAGSDKRTQKPLGAYQERFDHRGEREQDRFCFIGQIMNRFMFPVESLE
jgi:hypothetical protein